MADVIGEAEIQVTADTDAADRELRTGLADAFAFLIKSADLAADEVTNQFQQAARSIQGSLRDIGGADVWLPVMLQAALAAGYIEERFDDIKINPERSWRSRLTAPLASLRARITQAFVPDPEKLRALLHPVESFFSSEFGFAIAAGLAASVLPALSTALTAALSLGLGGGLIALGALSLKHSKKLADTWSRASQSIGKDLANAAKPLEGPFAAAMHQLAVLVDRIAPSLNRMFTALAPAIEPFAKAISELVVNMMPGLEAAMPGVITAFTELSKVLPSVGTEIGKFFKLMSENQETIRVGVNILITTANVLLTVFGATFTFLNDALLQWMYLWRTGYGIVSGIFRNLTNAWLGFVGAFTREEGITTETGTLVGTFERMGLAVGNMWRRLQEAVANSVHAIITAINFLRALPGLVISWFASMGAAIASLWNALVGAAQSAVNRIVGWWQGLLRLPGIIGTALANAYVTAVTWFTNLITRTGTWISQTIARARELIPQLPYIVGQAMGRALGTLVATTLQWMANVINWIRRTNQTITSGLALVPGIVARWFSSALTQMVSFLTRMWSQATSWMNRTREAIIDRLQALPGQIASIFTRVVDAVVRNVTRMWQQGSSYANRTRESMIDRLQALPGQVTSIFTRAVSAAVAQLGRLVEAALSGARRAVDAVQRGFSSLPGIITSAWSRAASAVSAGVSRVVGIASTIGSRITGAVGNLGGILFGAGQAAVQGLINGILSKLGAVRSAASSLAGAVRGAMPFSPAKYGPLSGRGAPERIGQGIASQLARGMMSSTEALENAAVRMASAVSGGIGPGMNIENVNVAPVTGRFSLQEVHDELVFQSRQLYMGTVH